MDLRREDLDTLHRLADTWHTTPGAEFEAMLTGMDLTAWQDVIQYLRSLGMREAPQIVRMNICLSNNIRITLEGAGVIQAYCRDNRIADKPFTAMLKENIQGAEPVSLNDYGARAKLKREIPLSADDERIKEVLRRWDSLGKHFRMIQRFEFVAPKGLPLRFDVSLVRENAGRPARSFQEARVTNTSPSYEAEVELTAARDKVDKDAATKLVIRGLSWLLQGRQRSYALVGNRRADIVRTEIAAIFGGSAATSNRNAGRNRAGPTRSFRFPGPQPATLERRHMQEVPEPGVPSLRYAPGGYNVTDKADGLRCLLYVSDIGRIYLVDGGGRVYATGKQTDKGLAGTVLDGEWIRRDRKGAAVSHYYAFDVLATKGGDKSVTAQPFMVPGAMLGSAVANATRQAAMIAAVSALSQAKQLVKGTPPAHDLQVGSKTFRTAAGDALFREAVTTVLDGAERAPYNTDGLIFTPNAAPLPLYQGTWHDQLKWKPPQENTIDFLVIVDKERDKKGNPVGPDAVGTKYREDSGQTVRYKTLRLFVGSNRDVAFADPRRTVLGDESLPASLDTGDWRPVEFRPADPRDPMAAVCYVGINEGATDPAGATMAATALDTESDVIRTTRTNDIIQSDMIVEMAYHPERAAGWRWEPMRIRHDKTERWLAGRSSGTMNADWVANSIWTTLHNPITETAIKTGIVEHCVPVAPSPAHRKAPGRSLMKVQCMRNFHNEIIKQATLFRPVAPGTSICDLGMGRGEDIGRFLTAQVSYVLGVDRDGDALNNAADGAYRNLLDKMIALGGRERVPPMVFVQADMARNLQSGAAGITAEDQTLLQNSFSTKGAFDVVSCMFGLQYMCADENTLAGFLTNLADTVKVGGYFIGCAPDGDAIARAFAGTEVNTIVGRDGHQDVWTMTRRYGSGVGALVPPTEAGLGLAVDVDFIAAGQVYTQYLVSWPYIQKMMATVGLELLTPEEIAAFGIPAATQMFSETWAAAGSAYAMSDAIRRLSFMNRWWIFRRTEDLRPAPPTAEPAAVPLTEYKPATEAEAALPVLTVEEAEEGKAEEGKAEEGEEAVIELPSPQFLVDPSIKTPDNRLGPDLNDWPRYMSLGTLTELPDIMDPTIKYPSVEAAIASAKYQRATNIPSMGPQIFRVEGAIHQKYEGEREKLRAAGASQEAIALTVDNQVAETRVQSGANKIKARKGLWDPTAWTSVREDVYREYLQRRYTGDARFRAMIDAIKAKGGEILMANGREFNELGVGVTLDGTIVGGENRVGKIMTALA